MSTPEHLIEQLQKLRDSMLSISEELSKQGIGHHALQLIGAAAIVGTWIYGIREEMAPSPDVKE